tara:strand:+ start:766 stop:981 length:216 start_codon:yes stop_codon:yes gene_type:complete
MNELINGKIIDISIDKSLPKKWYLEDELPPITLTIELENKQKVTLYPMVDFEGNGFGVIVYDKENKTFTVG